LDVIDAHFGYPDGAAAVRVAQRLGLPSVVTLRGVEEEQARTTLVGRELRAALRRADGCICVSHALAEVALRNGARCDRLAVIPNGVDRSVFNSEPALMTRAQLNLPDDRPVIVAVGNVIPRKQYSLLIRAMTERRVRRLRPTLVILGSMQREKRFARRLNALACELGLRDDVLFRGEVSPGMVAAHLKVADCFASVSHREGCCNAILEAIACQVPIVATAVGDNARFVAGNRGCLVDAKPQAIAEAIADTLASRIRKEDRNAWSEPDRDWSQVAEEVVGFFTKILGCPSRVASSV
jgi:glycosyltransferase involved in cell wall biosynthesis